MDHLVSVIACRYKNLGIWFSIETVDKLTKKMVFALPVGFFVIRYYFFLLPNGFWDFLLVGLHVGFPLAYWPNRSACTRLISGPLGGSAHLVGLYDHLIDRLRLGRRDDGLSPSA